MMEIFEPRFIEKKGFDLVDVPKLLLLLQVLHQHNFDEKIIIE